MDYIIKKLNSYIEVSEVNSVDRQTLLKERIEYMNFLSLGYLWNQTIKTISVENRKKIVENLNKMSIGEVVDAIRKLDVNQCFATKKQYAVFNKYPKLRNQLLGHGYTHGDQESELEEALEVLYQELIALPFFQKEFDIVSVHDNRDGKYQGIRYSSKDVGIPLKWTCPAEILGVDILPDTIFLLDNNMGYYCISPFVFIYDKGENVYVFQSLEDKLSGNVKLNQLFKSGIKNVLVPELVNLSYESERRRISSNGTIMNYFDRNYGKYISVPLQKDIKDFLKNNRSNIQATIWGNGGVGKTACVQSVCMEQFEGLQSDFAYIIFASAKDRKYDTRTGRLVNIANIRSYEEILDYIIAVVYDEDSHGGIAAKEERVLSITNRVLLVIDDYETFEDKEKEKIQQFINKLNFDYFRILITTRNKRFSTGVEIKLDELREDDTKKFLEEIFRNEYPKYFKEISRVLSDREKLAVIQEATSGRVLFLYHFANLFVQKGMSNRIVEDLKSSDNAKEFLYGKLYDYLGKTAQMEFVVISQIAGEKDLIFKESVLLYILSEKDKEELNNGLLELVEQKIIERYDEENYRIYSQDIFERMESCYQNSKTVFKDKIKTKINTIGGARIKGTVYEALLEEANASRSKGNVKDTLQKYKHILNEKECPKEIKKRAILNLTSYININLIDNEQTIAIFEEYMDKLEFHDDVDIVKMYVQYLWRADETAKAKACDILERFFSKKYHRKTDKKYIELFAMTVHYCSHNVMENTPEKVKVSAENRILNEYGRELFDWISTRTFDEYKPSERHNISLALIATIKVAINLTRQGYDKTRLIEKIKKFGYNNFNELFRKQLIGLQVGNKNSYISGEVVEACITYVARYYLLVDIKNIGRAIIHNTEFNSQQKQPYRVGEVVKAKIIGQNDQGYILSLRAVENSER